jgi:hypothetical protein
VVPDVSMMSLPGARAESAARTKGNEGYESEGVRGLKALGVRDLTYRLAFLCCTVESSNPKVSMPNTSPPNQCKLLPRHKAVKQSRCLPACFKSIKAGNQAVLFVV